MGGAISDLVSRVYALEQNQIRCPDLTKALYTKSISDTIIPNFSAEKGITTTEAETIPYDGWMYIQIHAETWAATDVYENSLIQVVLEGHSICTVDLSPPKQCLLEGDDTCLVPVKKGMKWWIRGMNPAATQGGSNWFVNPNHQGNRVWVRIFADKD